MVWIGWGCNQPPHAWRRVRLLRGLAQLPGVTLLAVSPTYVNPAEGPGVRGRFWNGIAIVRSRKPPLTLLTACKRLERRLGRAGAGDRPADLDLLAWRDALGWRRFAGPGLQIPHPRAAQRAFVRRPAAALQAEWGWPPGLGPWPVD